MNIKKNIYYFIFINFIIVFFNFNNHNIYAKTIIKVGIFDNAKLHNAKQTGYLDQYYNNIQKYSDIKFKYYYGNWDDLINKLENGKIDVLGFAAFSKERKKRFDYSFYSIGRTFSMISTSKDRNFSNESGFNILKNRKIGCIKSTIHEEKIKALLKKYDIPATIFLFKTKKAMYNSLKHKNIDFVIDENTRMLNPFEKILFNFSFQKTYFIAKKGNYQILSKIDYAINRILINKQKNINFKEFDLTKNEKEFLKSMPILKVGILKSNGYLSRKFGKSYKGIDVDVIDLLASELGIRVKKVELNSLDQAISFFRQQKIDMVSGFYYHEHLDKDFYVSIPYYNSKYYIIKNSNAGTNNKFSAAVSENSKHIFSDVINNYSFDNITYYDNILMSLKAVNNNDKNFTVIETDAADYYLRNNNFKNLKIELGHYPHLKSIAISKYLPFYFTTILNKSISNLDDNTISEIVLKNKIYDDSFKLFNKVNLSKNQLILIYESLILLIFFIIFLSYKKYKLGLAFKDLKENDQLTNTYNFEIFKKNVIPILANINKKKYAFVYIEFENLNYIKKVHGHEIEKKIIKLISSTIFNLLNENEYLCRINSTDFIGLLNFYTKKRLNERFLVAQQIIEKKFKDLISDSSSLIIKNGVFIIKSNVSFEQALINSKYAKNSIYENFHSVSKYYKNKDHENILFKEKINYSIKKALINKEFKFLYQPKLNWKTNEIIGAQVFIKWECKDNKTIPTNKFLPLLLENGIINELNIYILEEVLGKLEFLDIKGIKNIPLSFNFYLNNLQNNYSKRYMKVFNKYHFSNELLEFELKNFSSQRDIDFIRKKIIKLNKLKFNICLNLFQNNILYMQNIPNLNLKSMKFDNKLLKTLSKKELDKKLVDLIFEFSHNNNIRIICDEIDNKKQLESIKNLNYSYVQGKYFYPLLSFDDFYSLIK